MPKTDLMTIKEAAEYLNVSVDTLYAWRKRKERESLPRAVKYNSRQIRYSRAELDKFIDDHIEPEGVR